MNHSQLATRPSLLATGTTGTFMLSMCPIPNQLNLRLYNYRPAKHNIWHYYRYYRSNGDTARQIPTYITIINHEMDTQKRNRSNIMDRIIAFHNNMQQ